MAPYCPEIDLYGTKDLGKIKNDYILTSKESINPIRSYSNRLKPHEMSILYDFPGDSFSLTETIKAVQKQKKLKFIVNQDHSHEYPFLSFKELLLLLFKKIVRRLVGAFKFR